MRIRARRKLKARAVARDRTEVALPDPAEHVLCCFDPDELWGWFARGDQGFFGGGEGSVRGGEAGADEEDGGGGDGYVLLGDDGFEGREGDGVSGEGVVGYVVAGGPGVVVEEDAAAYYAAVFDPYCLRR